MKRSIRKIWVRLLGAWPFDLACGEVGSEPERPECFGRREILKGVAARMHVIGRERQVEKTLRWFYCVLIPVREISIWI